MNRRWARGQSVANREERVSESFPIALQFSLRGIIYAFHAEVNLKRDFWLFCILCVFELIVRPVASVVVLTLFVSMCVFAAEMFNTAIELAVDLASNWRYHPVAGVAKDVASGAVTMVSLGALVVATWLLFQAWPWKFLLLSDVHLTSAMIVLVSLILVSILRYWPYRSRGMIKRRRVEDKDEI